MITALLRNLAKASIFKNEENTINIKEFLLYCSLVKILVNDIDISGLFKQYFSIAVYKSFSHKYTRKKSLKSKEKP